VHQSVLLQGATGSGKSVMASFMIHKMRGKRVWFMVPRKELLRQMSEQFSDVDHSFIAAGKEFKQSDLYVCSLASVINRLIGLRAPDYCFIDETQWGEAGLDKVIQWLKAAETKIIGLSASPVKASGVGMGRWYDYMVIGPSVRWLIDNLRLAEYRAFSPHTPDLSGIRTVAGDYAKGQLSERMEQDAVLIGDAVKHYKKYAMGMTGVTFTTSIKHSMLMAEAYKNEGVIAVHMDGNTPEIERIRIAKGVARGEIDQITNCGLLGFGYDLAAASGIKGKNIQVLTDCDPSKSLSKQLQKNGRAMRYDGEIHFIFDHAGNIGRHGLPCEDHKWTLDSLEKTKRGEQEKIIQVKKCDKCYFDHKPAPVCPNCGHVYEIQYREVEQVDGELVEVEKKQKRQEVGRARTADELWRIAEERGYKSGWVYKQMQLKRIKS